MAASRCRTFRSSIASAALHGTLAMRRCVWHAQGMRRVLGRPRYSKEAVFYVMDRLIHSFSYLLIRRERCLNA
uniref:Putative secreted protein n=1 Tax=Ixodes ricinus TaxID=34613 RepID=A0A6B0TUL7_IXORI